MPMSQICGDTIEVMRPHCYVHFVPFSPTPMHPGTETRRAVGDAFFRGVAAGPGA